MIVVVSGPGGVGKGTVVERLVAGDPQLELSRSWTTRPQRPGEPDDAYHFVDDARFEAHRAAGGFLETNTLGDWSYGTPMPSLDERDARDLVLEIEVNGGRQVLELFPDALMIFIDTPSVDEQRARLLARGDDEEHVALRLEVGRAERIEASRLGYIVVINDDVDDCVERIAGLVDARRRSRARDGGRRPVD